MNAPLKAVHFEDPLAPHVRAMLEALGEDPQREGLAQTPARYAKAMRYIEFHSLCEHHLLPFYGRVHVGYLPGERIIGLSKIPRLVDLFARRFQVQERLTEQVADALVKVLEPRGVLVVAEARHLCMAMRGVQKQHSSTTTRATRGAYHELLPDVEQRHRVAVRG